MKMYRMSLNISSLPESVKEILKKLETESNLAVKGGLARLVLLHSLKKAGKVIEEERMAAENKVKDLDIIIFHSQRLAESRNYLLKREKELREILSEVLTEKHIDFNGRDIEPVRGSLKKSDKTRTLTKVLRTRDLTINEVVLISEKGRWVLYYSPRCWRDLISSVGMLTSGGWKTVRYETGRMRMLPTNYGFFRLLRFWVEGKVKKIWLPSWMRRAHLQEMARLQRKGALPEGANLGRYALVVWNQYKDAEMKIKNRWMIALNSLGFTDLLSFDVFVKEQQLLDAFKYQQDFTFEDDIPLSEIIEKLLTERKKKQEDREKRKAEMATCSHNFKTINCNDCPQHCEYCKFRMCPICNYVEKKEFPCNLMFQAGDWRRDINSLICFPYRARTRKKAEKNKFSYISS